MNRIPAKTLLVTVPLILLLGIASGWLSGSGEGNLWYAALDKPWFVPPGWVFPLAWTTLYILMGIALALVLEDRGAPGRGRAIGLFVTQLLLNLAWSPLFFGLHQVRIALAVVIAMAVIVAVTIALFHRIRPLAAWLLLPYLAWLCLATALNWEVARLNPSAETLVPGEPRGQIAR
ncbi:tryptophan-rich sensory protein [Sphingomonas zeicaulis]|uniref:TspO/MBR family protein n=1 Tax=Sphingomonas zeicaulis TaxID=1632740 RepID=UPI003D235E84